MISKTMKQQDFTELDYQIQHIRNIDVLLSGVQHRFEHPNRVWEYGLALDIIRKHGLHTVLDVGGGGSIFAPACAWLDIEVLQVDPGDVSHWIRDQERAINKILPFKQLDFFEFDDTTWYDAVTCLSVIEHVPNDLEFLLKLASFVKLGGYLILTTDFHPSGKALVDGHIRTYNEDTLKLFISLLPEFRLEDGYTDYSYENAVPVNSYTFASLILKRMA